MKRDRRALPGTRLALRGPRGATNPRTPARSVPAPRRPSRRRAHAAPRGRQARRRPRLASRPSLTEASVRWIEDPEQRAACRLPNLPYPKRRPGSSRIEMLSTAPGSVSGHRHHIGLMIRPRFATLPGSWQEAGGEVRLRCPSDAPWNRTAPVSQVAQPADRLRKRAMARHKDLDSTRQSRVLQ
jgi:hypothetical protein